MKKEFKLSEKRFTSKCGWDVVQTEDIKEFIKLETELINQFACGQITLLELKQEREELTGDLK